LLRCGGVRCRLQQRQVGCDQHFARMLNAYAGIIINTGEDNYLTTADAIEAEVAGKMEAMKALGAAYFLHTDHSVSPKVSFASYQYAMEVYRTHCRY